MLRSCSPIADAYRAMSSGGNERWPARKFDQRSSSSASFDACSRFASVGSRVPQTEALLALPDQVAKIIRNTLPEPVVAAVGMFPGTRHRKSHLYHPCVPIRAAKAYDNQWPVDFIGLLCVLAEREGLSSPLLIRRRLTSGLLVIVGELITRKI